MRQKKTPSAADPTQDPQALPDRRAPRQGGGTGNPLQQLKAVLARPMALQWRDGHPRVEYVERRSAARLDRVSAQLCTELRERLVAQGADEARRLLRFLVIVHETLARKGWDGVGALPATVLHKAIRQVDMLALEEASPGLAQISAKLRELHVHAQARDQARKDEQAQAKAGQDDDIQPSTRIEVSETSFEEFEDLERKWAGTQPSELAPLSAER